MPFLPPNQQHQSIEPHTTPQPFYGPFSGTTRVSRCQKRISRLYGAREDNGGRHTNHLAKRHSIRTITSAHLHHPHPKHWRQQFIDNFSTGNMTRSYSYEKISFNTMQSCLCSLVSTHSTGSTYDVELSLSFTCSSQSMDSFQKHLKIICLYLLLTTPGANPAPLIQLHFNDHVPL